MDLPGWWPRLTPAADREHGGDSSTERHPDRPRGRPIPDGGDPDSAADEESDSDSKGDAGEDPSSSSVSVDRSNVEVSDAGEAEPSDPKWEKPDPSDIPEFEVRVEEPVDGVGHGDQSTGDRQGSEDGSANPTAGMPNTAGSPGTRIKAEGTEGYVAALELCARLPDDIRLPDDAADVVPVAVEAELENDVQAFAAAEFDNPSPHVETLSFEEVDDEIWMRLRLGVPGEAFADLDPDEIRAHALQQLEGLF